MINISIGKGISDLAKRAIFENIINENLFNLENCDLT